MRFNHETLAKLSKTATYEIQLQRLGPRSKKAVCTAIRDGFIQTTSGEAATYHDIITSHFELPMLAFSKRTKWWDALLYKNIPESYVQGLTDWWNLDRVTCRMEDPEKWQKLALYRYMNYTEMSAWKVNQSDQTHSVSMMSTKNLDVFKGITHHLVTSAEYKEKANHICELVMTGSILTIQYSGE